MKRIAYLVAFLMAISSVRAQAANPGIQGAQLAVGLFAHTCLLYPTDIDKLRDKIKGMGIPALTPDAQAALMKDHPGAGFDASVGTPDGVMRMVLLSGDDSSCTVLAEHSDPNELVKNILINLDVLKASVNADYRLLGEQGDEQDLTLRHRFYLVILKNTPFNLVVSVTKADRPIQGFITFSPRSPDEPIPPAPEESQ